MLLLNVVGIDLGKRGAVGGGGKAGVLVREASPQTLDQRWRSRSVLAARPHLCLKGFLPPSVTPRCRESPQSDDPKFPQTRVVKGPPPRRAPPPCTEESWERARVFAKLLLNPPPHPCAPHTLPARRSVQMIGQDPGLLMNLNTRARVQGAFLFVKTATRLRPDGGCCRNDEAHAMVCPQTRGGGRTVPVGFPVRMPPGRLSSLWGPTAPSAAGQSLKGAKKTGFAEKTPGSDPCWHGWGTCRALEGPG